MILIIVCTALCIPFESYTLSDPMKCLNRSQKNNPCITLNLNDYTYFHDKTLIICCCCFRMILLVQRTLPLRNSGPSTTIYAKDRTLTKYLQRCKCYQSVLFLWDKNLLCCLTCVLYVFLYLSVCLPIHLSAFVCLFVCLSSCSG